MSDCWDEKAFENFIQLRDGVRAAKRAKNHQEVIALCSAILQIDKRAKFLRILTPLFHKEMGNAYFSLDEIPKAIEYFHLAKEGYFGRQSADRLNQPDSWVNDIAILEKKLLKLQSLQQRDVSV